MSRNAVLIVDCLADMFKITDCGLFGFILVRGGSQENRPHKTQGRIQRKLLWVLKNVVGRPRPFSGHACKLKREIRKALINLKIPLFISKDENATVTVEFAECKEYCRDLNHTKS